MEEETQDQQLSEDSKFWHYEHNPLPWWLTILWILALGWGVVYLVLYLL